MCAINLTGNRSCTGNGTALAVPVRPAIPEMEHNLAYLQTDNITGKDSKIRSHIFLPIDIFLKVNYPVKCNRVVSTNHTQT